MPKPIWAKNIKVIVWDLDQTLYPQHVTIKTVFHDLVSEKLAKLLGLPYQETKSLYRERHQKYKVVAKAIHSFGLDAYDLVAKVVEQIDWENFLHKDEQLVKMFKLLQKRLKNILLSDNTMDSALRKINLLGLKPNFFTKMFLGLDLKMTKPDLNLYRLVLDYTRLPAEDHLMVGDSELGDIIPAKKVGMHTCLVWAQSAVADISLAKVYDVVKLFQ
jgi:FMN phosphatase YigB (HAD superfamily)